MATKNFKAGFDFKRLPTSTTWGSKAFYRKVATQDARLAMTDVIAKYAALLNKLHASSPDILVNALRPIFKRAQYYVPEDTGALWESGKLEGKMEGGKPTASITFGNEEAWYAAMVHEYVWLAHQEPTRAKFLQHAMEEGIDGIMESLKVDYTRILK